MTLLPVITRELRAQARQPLTFTLRLLGVLALLVGGAAFALHRPFLAGVGGELFGYLHLTLFLAIWILVPLSAAECISRERREGTLGLLFLTPLRAADIVIAKGLAHGLRALGLWVAVLPVLTIPFLLGGVTWMQATLSVLINFSAICWALAAALLASSANRSGLRALVSAVVFALGAFVACGTLAGAFFQTAIVPGAPRMSRGSLPGEFALGISLMGDGLVGRPFLGLFSPRSLLRPVAEATVCSVLVLGGAVRLAAWQIRRSWREEPPPVWMQRVRRTLCTPVVWVGFFRRWMRWKLRRNPIGWLEQRTWQGRLVMWSWFAVIISLYSAVLTDRNFFRDLSGIQAVFGWVMMGSLAASAAGSFRRERETGVLELLLVAPLTTQQIIGGRLRGLWGRFLPALGILLGIWLYFDAIFRRHEATRPVIFFSICFLTLPVIGLYFSLRCRYFMSAFLLTLACGLIAPVALDRLRDFYLRVYGANPYVQGATVGLIGLASLAQIALALFLGARLCRRLETRSFPFERAAM